ncbi:MAG: hypothetical protein ACKOQ0_02580 [Solirubrobacterales bacterium]
MRPALAAALAAAALLAGCGGPSADLYLVERAGSTPGARLTMLVGDGGTVTCNRGAQEPITSAQLIEARAIADGLNGDEEEPGPAARGLELAPQPGSIFRYRVRSEAGVVAFSDNSKGQPEAFYRLARLTRRLSKEACGLAR